MGGAENLEVWHFHNTLEKCLHLAGTNISPHIELTPSSHLEGLHLKLSTNQRPSLLRAESSEIREKEENKNNAYLKDYIVRSLAHALCSDQISLSITMIVMNCLYWKKKSFIQKLNLTCRVCYCLRFILIP